MANFSALKTAIQNAIRQNGNEEITGNLLQQILLSVVNTMGDGAINTIEQNLSQETLARQNGDNTLQSHIDAEALARGNADTQLQNAINAIKANIDNGYVYGGIATPSSTPVSGKVFYIATAAGTYTNFGGQVLTQGINILRYNGSSWSHQQLIGIDDVPTVASNSLVKSGGVQNELALGAVYDVSAKNPTAGPNNDGKWESLSALLSDANLNTLIPTAYRKGGMSVKFVQSSDNQYVQARCMAQNFTIDVTQWQGVDDGPIAGSENLVKSGGIYNNSISISGILDKGTNYSQKDSTDRVTSYYKILDKDAHYSLLLKDVNVSNADNYIRVCLTSAKSPYSGDIVYTVKSNIKRSFYIEFDIPDEYKDSAVYVAIYQATTEGTASFNVTLTYNNNVINKKSDYENNCIPIPVVGVGRNNIYPFKTISGYTYIVSFPKKWTVSEVEETTAFIVRKRISESENVNIESTRIRKSDFGLKDNFVQFDADGSDYELYVCADTGQKLYFYVYPIGNFDTILNPIREDIEELSAESSQNSDSIYEINYNTGLIDKGTVYSEKYGTTNRTCVFYKILDKNKSYKIKVSNTVIPEGNYVVGWILSDKSPYSAARLNRFFRVSSSGDSFDGVVSIPDEYKNSATYIGIFQQEASSDTCSFKVEMSCTDSLCYLPNDISTLYNEVANVKLNSFLIDEGTTYSAKFGSTNRTCVFYDLIDTSLVYKIRVTNTVVPSGTRIVVLFTKDKSPYGTSRLTPYIGNIYNGEDFYKDFSVSEELSSEAKYIAVIQLDGNSDLCSFDVELTAEKALENRIENIEDKVPSITKDAIPYNDFIFADGRIIKIYNPYKESGSNQYTGQLHCHTWGHHTYNNVNYKVPIGYTVEQIAAMTENERIAAVLSVNQQFVAAHKTVGFDFMTITNYDDFADYTEAPETMPENFIWLGNGFEANLGGWDATAQTEDNGAHMCIINTDWGKKFNGYTTSEVVEYAENRNCVVTYAHPFLNMLYSSPGFAKRVKKRLRFIEVFNGLGYHHVPADGVPYIKPGIELDEDFDALLTQGNFIFGIAVSDERVLDTSATSPLKWGCVKVFADSLTHKGIWNALLNGNFYSCENVDNGLVGVELDGNSYKVNVGSAGVTVEFLKENNTILSTVLTTAENTIAQYNIQGTEKFVRARIYTLVNGERTNQMWTQPIRLSPKIL